ncbi:hypothetical protein KY289_029277 [Solanum tuberosum]|nr:hypothetical protein KY289_029277 [Solanum tuberosum]KAH0661916.1 hypothetical protein KY284_026847 [Solanum tuberosum]
MDVNNLLDYPSESDTCSEVQSLEKIVDTIEKSNVDDEVEDDIIPLEPVTPAALLLKFYHYARRTVPLPTSEFPPLSHFGTVSLPATSVNQQQPLVLSTSSTHSNSSHQTQSTSRAQAAARTAADLSVQQPATGRWQPSAFRTITRDSYEVYGELRMNLKMSFREYNQEFVSQQTHGARHKGEHLAECISNCLLDWNLDNVFTVTVDNASSNDVAVLELSKKLDMWETNMMEDVPTRWNSTYLMLDTAEKFEKAFERFDLYDGNFNSFLATDICEDGSIAGSIQYEDWANVRNITKFLEKFYELTLKVSGSRYVTCNVHFEDICELDAYLKVCMTSDDVDLSKMASGMKEKFKKYRGTPEKMNKMLFIASVLDPRNKFMYIWWKVNSPRFPILSQLSRDVLAIPMSSVASECAFSTGGRILDPFRSSLTPKCVQCLIYVQDWLRQETKPICVEESLEFLEKIELGGLME